MKDERQFWAGMMFVAFGVITFVQVPHYAIGSAMHMGPGYFPMLIAIALVVFGATAALRSFNAAAPAAVGKWPLVPLAFVTLGVVAFSALIERAGLIVATLCLILLACYQRVVRRPLEVAAIFIAVAVLTAAVFIYGIGLPIALW